MLDPFRTIHYEVSPDPDPGDATDAGAEPAAEAEAWTPPTQDEWELANERLERLNLLEQQGQQQQEPEDDEEAPELDPFDPNFAANLDRYISERTMTVQQQQQQEEEAIARARDMVHDISARDGEFLNPAVAEERVLQIANTLAPQMYQRYGVTEKAAEAAIAKAAEQVRAEELVAAKAYHERQVNQVSTLAGARREPSASGSGTDGAAAPRGEGSTMARHFGTGTGG